MFGQGLGAAEPATYNRLPHNEYLRLLVDGGVVGLILYVAAVFAWGRRVLGLIRPDERGFVWALFLALGVYALTDNILLMPPGLIPFLYLAVMRIPSTRGARRRRRRRSRTGKRRRSPRRAPDLAGQRPPNARSTNQSAAIAPIAQAGNGAAQRGQTTSRRRSAQHRLRNNPTTASWPISTPRLKPSNASTSVCCGRARSASTLAKPKPWIRPKPKATSHSRRVQIG